MSKLSKFLIGVMVVWFAAMSAWRAQQLYSAYIEKVNSKKEYTPMFAVVNAGEPPATAQAPVSTMAFTVPDNFAAPQTSNARPFAQAQLPASYKDNVIPQPAQLPTVTHDAQVQQRAQKAYNKYSSNPLIQNFNRDLQAAGMQNIDFTNLAGADFAAIMQQNPQLQAVLLRYSQNPQFVKLLQQMLSDPEIVAVTKEIKQQNKN